MAKAFIYWNLHKECFSVKYRGQVIAHANRVLVQRAEFRVLEAGRQRVLTEKRKNVHAGVVAELEDVFCDSLRNERADARLDWPVGTDILATNATQFGVQVRYNPYEAGHFKIVGNGQCINKAAVVYGSRNLLGNRPALWAERFS